MKKNAENVGKITETNENVNKDLQSENLEQNTGTEVKTDLSFLQNQLIELQNRLSTLETENTQLKQSTKKPLTTDERRILLANQSRLLKQLDEFAEKKATLNFIEIDTESDLESKDYKFQLIQVGNNKPIISISNQFILNEMREFILQQIGLKMQSIENQLSEIEL